jgi:hypothetical protein
MKNSLLLVAKILGFAIVLIWILGFIMAAFSWMDTATKFTANWMGYGPTSPIIGVFVVWYVFTVVVLAALAAYRGFLVVGRWIRPNADK